MHFYKLFHPYFISLSIVEVSARVGNVSSYCNPSEAKLIAQYFLSADANNSKCPLESWLNTFQRLSPSTNKVFVNVGCNKGYNLAHWASVWVPTGNVSSREWYKYLAMMGVNECGVCKECNSTFPLQTDNGILGYTTDFHPLLMIGIDINPLNLELITNISNQFNVENLNKIHIHIKTIHAAVTNHNTFVSMPKCTIAREDCSIQIPSKNEHLIPAITIDTLISNLHLHNRTNNNDQRYWIDILLIDTEGGDPQVLIGTRKTLKKKKIRMLVFEYHYIGYWRGIRLHSWIKLLTSFGYVCYYEGTSKLWEISGMVSLEARDTNKYCKRFTYLYMCVQMFMSVYIYILLLFFICYE